MWSEQTGVWWYEESELGLCTLTTCSLVAVLLGIWKLASEGCIVGIPFSIVALGRCYREPRCIFKSRLHFQDANQCVGKTTTATNKHSN